MTIVTTTALVLLLLAGASCLTALLRRRSLADRIVALELALVTAVSGIAVFAIRTGEATFLPVLVVTSLVGFAGSVTVARYLERRGT